MQRLINVHADVSTVWCKLTTYDLHNFEFINSFTIKDDFAKHGFLVIFSWYIHYSAFYKMCKNKPL